jgi:hypothetical protein
MSITISSPLIDDVKVLDENEKANFSASKQVKFPRVLLPALYTTCGLGSAARSVALAADGVKK